MSNMRRGNAMNRARYTLLSDLSEERAKVQRGATMYTPGVCLFISLVMCPDDQREESAAWSERSGEV